MKLSSQQLRTIVQETLNEAASGDTWERAAQVSNTVLQQLNELDAILRHVPNGDLQVRQAIGNMASRMERLNRRIAGAAAGSSPDLKI
jgi:hypothetical protein